MTYQTRLFLKGSKTRFFDAIVVILVIAAIMTSARID